MTRRSSSSASSGPRPGGRAACWRRGACWRRSAPRSRCGWSRARRPTRWSGRSARLLPGDRALPRALRRRAGRRARARATLTNLVLRRTSTGSSGSRAACRATSRRTRRRRAARDVAVRGAGADQAGAGRLRAGHVHQLGGRRDPDAAAGAHRRPTQAQAQKAGRGGAQGGARAQGAPRPSRTRPAESAAAGRLRQFLRELLQINLKYGLGLTGAPTAQRPGVRLLAGVRPHARRLHAEGALRLPVPQQGLGADPGAPQARPDATRSARDAIALIRAGGRDARVEARRRRATRSRARRSVVDDVTDALSGSVLRLLVVALVVMALVLALVFRSRAAAAAAAGRARPRSARHVRGDGAARRAADDGLDRRAAGAARPRRSTTRSSTRRGWRRRAATPARAAAAGGADDRHRGAGHGRRLPRAAAVAGADGARVRRAAGGRHRARVRASR